MALVPGYPLVWGLGQLLLCNVTENVQYATSHLVGPFMLMYTVESGFRHVHHYLCVMYIAEKSRIMCEQETILRREGSLLILFACAPTVASYYAKPGI